MDYHFIAQPLDHIGTAKSIEQISHKIYPRTFLLPSHIIGRIPRLAEQDVAISAGFDELIQNYTLNSLSNNNWLPEDGTYTVLLQEQMEGPVERFIRRTCDQHDEFNGKDTILFIEAALFRYLHHSLGYSVIALDPYLVWDIGDKEWPETMSLSDAETISLLWSGAGSLSYAQRKWHHANAEKYSVNDAYFSASYASLRTELNQRAEKMVAAHDAIAASKQQEDWIQPSLRVAYRLLRYLPPRKKDSTLINYGYNAATGMMPFHGPIPWRGWRDDLLDDLERDMVFESWLVPFQSPTTDQWLLQPGSLLLLYWAFDVAGIEPDLSPQDFINQHEWQGWFGERIHTHAK